MNRTITIKKLEVPLASLTLDAALRRAILDELHNSGPLSLRAIAGRMYHRDQSKGGDRIDILRTSRVLAKLYRKTGSRTPVFTTSYSIYPADNESGNRRPTLIYSKVQLTWERHIKFELLLLAEKALLSQKALRDAGQAYAKALFTKNGAFTVQAQARIEGQPKLAAADLLVIDRSDPERRFVVEVKNQHKAFDKNSYELAKLMRQAIALDATPVLAASFLSDEGRLLCRKLGIATIEFHRQFFPATATAAKNALSPMRALKKLHQVLHPPLFELVALKRPLKNRQTAKAKADLAMISDPEWADRAARRWLRIRNTVAKQLGIEWPKVRYEQKSWPRRLRSIKRALHNHPNDYWPWKID